MSRIIVDLPGETADFIRERAAASGVPEAEVVALILAREFAGAGSTSAAFG